MNRKLEIVVIVCALFLCTVKAYAVETASCEIMTISASNTGEGIDPALSAYAPVFKQEPFSKFNTFKLIGKQTHKLELSIPSTLSLPNSLSGFLRLNSVSEGKLNLTLTLVREGKSPININGIASPGSPFFAAGLNHPGGVWIFGVVCNNNGIISH